MHMPALVNCLQNVVNILLLVNFVELGMFYSCVAAKQVSPVESWKGLCYNVFFCSFVLAMMLAFKDTLEALILFENSKRSRETKKEATTTITMHKDSAVVQHVDNGSTNTAWQTFAGYALSAFLCKPDTKGATPDASTKNEANASMKNERATRDAFMKNGDDAKAAASTASDDEIKEDVASASSSTRSSADTSDALV